MAKEKFDCSNCGGSGSISYKEIDSRFDLSVIFCPFCGADLDIEIPEVEEDYEE